MPGGRGTNSALFLPANVRAGLLNAPTAPSAVNPFVTLADLSGGGGIYGGSGTVPTTTTATVTDTLTFSGGTTITTQTVTGDTVTAGTGTNPTGFGLLGSGSLIDHSGQFDLWTFSYDNGAFPNYRVTMYDNTTFLENASIDIAAKDFSGTDRPYGLAYYTSDTISYTGLQWDVNGELLLSQLSGIVTTPIGAGTGPMYVNSSGYIKIATYADFAAQLPTLYIGNSTIGAGRIATQGGQFTIRQTTSGHEFIVENVTTGSANITVSTSAGAAGDAVLKLDARAANSDSYVNFANTTTEYTVGYDSSVGLFKMSTSAIATGTFYEYDSSVSEGRHISSLGIGGAFPGATTRLAIRGASSDASTTILRAEKLDGTDALAIRGDGLAFFQTTVSNPNSGTVSKGISGVTTNDIQDIHAAINWQHTHAPTVNGSGRAQGGYVRAVKSGTFTCLQLTGFVGEAFNTGTGNIAGGAAIVRGVLAQGRNTGQNVTLTALWGLDANVQTQAGVGNEATITDMGSVMARLDQTQDTNVTNQYHFKGIAPTNISGANVTNTYGLYLESNTLGTTGNWGVYVLGATRENYFEGSVSIGATTADSVAKLEVTSTTKGFRLTPMTAAQASAITPVEGLMVMVSTTDATFTSIGYWAYENGAWTKH